MVHFNWTQLIGIVGHHNIHIATAALTTLLLLVLAITARVSLGNGQTAVAPAAKFSLRGVFELILELIVSLNDMVLGPGQRAYVPLFGSIFVFILANNMMGLVPGMTPATDNYNTTLAVGLFTFVVYNYYGIKEHGLAYFKHFLGPVMWLAWLMLPIELVSHLARPLSLGLRLMVPLALYLRGIFNMACIFTIRSTSAPTSRPSRARWK